MAFPPPKSVEKRPGGGGGRGRLPFDPRETSGTRRVLDPSTGGPIVRLSCKSHSSRSCFLSNGGGGKFIYTASRLPPSLRSPTLMQRVFAARSLVVWKLVKSDYRSSRGNIIISGKIGWGVYTSTVRGRKRANNGGSRERRSTKVVNNACDLCNRRPVQPVRRNSTPRNRSTSKHHRCTCAPTGRYPARVSRASVHSCSSLRVIYPLSRSPFHPRSNHRTLLCYIFLLDRRKRRII